MRPFLITIGFRSTIARHSLFSLPGQSVEFFGGKAMIIGFEKAAQKPLSFEPFCLVSLGRQLREVVPVYVHRL
jgi:hypothetical protein